MTGSSYLGPQATYTNNSEAEVDFLRVELRTGLTFSKIALGAVYQEKRDRNRRHARRAYDTLLYFMRKITVPNGHTDDIMHRLTDLQSDLQRLGEEV